VPEIWRAYKKAVRIYVLADDHYEESAMSCAFPFVSAESVSVFLAKGLAEGEGSAAHASRQWICEHHQPASSCGRHMV
jgi:hypothetical protein